MAREMKDSGIEWIGKIPANWTLRRLQWCLIEVTEKNDPIKTTQILSLTNKQGVLPYEDKGAQGNKAKENLAEYKLAYEDTLIVNSMNVIIGSVGISHYFDKECAEIDTILEKTHNSIEEYKKLKQAIITQAVTKGVREDRPMKESGIIWLDAVPEDWEISKIKYAIFPHEKPVFPTDDVITCFRDGTVTLRKNRREEGFTFLLLKTDIRE